MKNYFGPPRAHEIDCPVCGNRTTLRRSGARFYISTHIVVTDGTPDNCQGSRTVISDRSLNR